MPYLISASESVLLGRALEEYLQAVDDSGHVYFLDFLERRLGPFYPPICRVNFDSCDNKGIPPDVDWEAIPESGTRLSRLGFAPSSPDSWFLGLEDATAFRISRDRTSRPLLDVLAAFLAPHVARNIGDEARFNLALAGPWGKVQQQAWLFNLAGRKRSRSGADNPAKIEEALLGLVERTGNSWTEFFRAGRAVGRVLADCLRYEAHFLHVLGAAADDELESGELDWWDEDEDVQELIQDQVSQYAAEDDRDLSQELIREDLRDEQRELIRQTRSKRHKDHDDGFDAIGALEWRDRLVDHLSDLQQAPVLDDWSSAPACLRAVAASLDKCNDPGDWVTESRELARVRDATQLAFGEILGSARRADDARLGDTPRPRIPRMLRMSDLTRESSIEDIRAALEHFEPSFDERSAFVPPKRIVASLAFAIETLAKRVWPQSFASQGPKTDIGNVLSERVRNGSDRERRFASIAITLYKEYRNPSQHGFDRFSCTWREACAFHLQLLQLLEWSEEMAVSNKK